MTSTINSAVNAARETLSQNFGGIAQKLAPAEHQFSLDEVPDQTGKVAVVTGGSQGIGYGTTHTLLSKNISKLYILSTSKETVDSAVDAVREELGEDKASRTHWLQCDMGDWDRVEAVAKEITCTTDRLDILVCNAARGIMTFQLTDRNVDRHMAVNHIGHVILTSTLLPLLKKTADAGHTVRISNQASNAHQSTPEDPKFSSLSALNEELDPMAAYGRSKLAAILYSRWFARHVTPSHPRLLSNATHPGVVATKMSTEEIHEPYPLAGYAMSVGLQPFKKDQFDGALSTLWAVTKAEESGLYVCPPAAIEEGSELARSEAQGEQLMKLTREILEERWKKDVPSFI